MPDVKRYRLPWNEAEHYWIALLLPDEGGVSDLPPPELGLKPVAGKPGMVMLRCGRQWGKEWKAIADYLNRRGLMQDVSVSIIPGETMPSLSDILLQLKPATVIHNIAEHLWLGDAMIDGHLTCHMQSVIDQRGVVYGHESFVRMVRADGEIIGGAKIIAASRELNLQHALDRYLHVLAVQTFTSSNLTGCLFVNFISGFIHRPAVYLESLTEACLRYGMPPKHIVLDVTQAENQRDIQQVKNIVDYGRSRGFLVALDDIESVDKAEKIIPQIRPDFLKLDVGLVQRSLVNEDLNSIKRLVAIAHDNGALTLAEGVESKPIHKVLLEAGVDLFQGYLFSKPSAATQVGEQAHG